MLRRTFQDDMQMNPKLKINFGLRWDLAFPVHE